jgi:hypothetical protein
LKRREAEFERYFGWERGESQLEVAAALYVGFGGTTDESAMVGVPAGGVYVAPDRPGRWRSPGSRDGRVNAQGI